MEYVIAVLPSRTQVMSFYQFLRRLGVGCYIIDTPREISKSCGVCVKFSKNQYQYVRSLSMQNYRSIRFYKYSSNNYGKISLLNLQ